MKRFKAWLSALIAAALTLGAAATPSGAEAALSARQPREEALPIAYADDAGNVYLIDGDCADGAILDMDAAARLVDTAAEMFGGGEDTHFEPWREVGDTVGNRYYIFRQMYADTTVSGGAVKVVTDAQGTVLGLTASVETELPDVEASAGITAEEAEAEIRRLIEDPAYREGMKADYAEIRRRLGGSGASRAVAKAMIELEKN